MPVPVVNSITESTTGQASPSMITRVIKRYALLLSSFYVTTLSAS